MASRTDKASIEVTRGVRDDLNSYIKQLKDEFGRQVTQAELISVLIRGVPSWQTEAMIVAYRPRVDPGSSNG